MSPSESTPDAPAARTLPEARWSCHGCGACCTGFAFGPVRDEIIEGLEAADIAALWPPAAEAPWRTRQPGPDGQEAWFLTHRDGRCVFLEADKRCAVHRLLGPEAKPAFCREYPFLVTQAPDGPAVTVRADCGGLHATFEGGEPVSAQAAEVLALPRLAPPLRWSPPHVEILPGVAVGPETWIRLEPRLLDRVAEAARSPQGHVAEVRAALHRVLDREAPPPSAEAELDALRAVIYALSSTLARGLEGAPPDLPPARRDPLAASWRALERALDRLDALDPGDPWPELAPSGSAYLRLVLRSRLLARRVGGPGGLAVALGGFLLHAAVARLGTEAPGPHEAADLGPTLSTWLRVSQLPVLNTVLERSRPALADLFWNAEG